MPMAAHFLRFPLIEVCSGFLYLSHRSISWKAQCSDSVETLKKPSATQDLFHLVSKHLELKPTVCNLRNTRVVRHSLPFDPLECLRQNKILRWPRETLSRFVCEHITCAQIGCRRFKQFSGRFVFPRTQTNANVERTCVCEREHLMYTCVCPGAFCSQSALREMQRDSHKTIKADALVSHSATRSKI
jgi:hypothetical protein